MNKSQAELSTSNSPQEAVNKDLFEIDLTKKKRIKALKIKKAKILESTIRKGKWDKEEHNKFLDICLIHGSNWPKIQEILQTRTCAQIRSHAQKFIIKLCKKYQIKIKSKKFQSKDSKHLNFMYKKKIVNPRPVEPEDQLFLDLFNYYKREQKIFQIEKQHKDHDSNNCPFMLRKIKRFEKSNKNKNSIWNINKTSNDEESNLLYVPNQTIIHSENQYNPFNDFNNINDFCVENDFSKGLVYSNIKEEKNSNSFKLSSYSGTPNKINSTHYSLNSKNTQSLSFNSRKSNFIDLNELSNDFSQEKFNEDISMNGYFHSNLSREQPNNIKRKIIEDKANNCRKSFFNNLKKEKREEFKIIGKITNDFPVKNVQVENVEKNLKLISNKDLLDSFYKEIQSINNYNLITMNFLKNASYNLCSNRLKLIMKKNSLVNNDRYNYFDNVNFINNNSIQQQNQIPIINHELKNLEMDLFKIEQVFPLNNNNGFSLFN